MMVMICGLCGRSYYLVGAANSYWQCSGRFDLVKPCTNALLHDETLSEMWRIIVTKLSCHAEDILLPLIGQLEKITENFADTADSARLNEIRTQKMTLRKMCAEGLVSYGEVLNAETALNAEYAALSNDLRRRSEHNDELINEIKTLYKAVSHGDDCRTAILKAVRIVHDTADFTLLGGLHITMSVPVHEKQQNTAREPIAVIHSLARCGNCGGRLSRRRGEGVYRWKCQNRRCRWWKVKYSDEEMLRRVTDVFSRVRCDPRLIRLCCPVTEYRPTKRVIAMQNSLEKLIASGGSAEMLVKAAVDLAAEKIGCIEYSKLNEQTAQIEDALNSDMGEFLSRAVRHIYVTPDRVRVKFINGKTVKSERSTNNE